MLQTNAAIGASTLDTPAPFNSTPLGAAPDHVDPLLWQLASPAERELLKFAGTAANDGGAPLAGNTPSALPKAQPTASPRTEAAPAATTTPATSSTSSADQAALVKITDQFRARFTEAAKDPAKFNDTLRKAFGDRYDAAAAEGLRQQALRNDFSWMPKIEVVSGTQLADQSGTQGEGVGRGAYSQANDTIYLNRELLHTDPAMAERVLTEEVGHAIDARINTQDAVGDEGDIFSALMHGDKVSESELQAMRADNDHGVINVNGQRVEVEYSFFSKVAKKIKGAVKSVGNFVKNTVKAGFNVAVGLATFDFNRVKEGFQQGFDAAKQLAKDTVDAIKESWNDLKKNFKKLMQSKVFGVILMICRYIPIPIVQAVVWVIDMVKAAYAVYQGVKNKAWGAVLGGVASLVGGAADVAGKFGVSASTVSSIKSAADTVKDVGSAYQAASAKNFGQAAMLVGKAFGAPEGMQDTLQVVASAETVVKAVEKKDYAGAVAGMGELADTKLAKDSGISSDETAKSIKEFGETAKKAQNVVKAVEKKDYGTAASGLGELGSAVVSKLGTSESKPDGAKEQEKENEILSDAKKLARGAQQAAAVVNAINKKDYGGAVAAVGELAAGPAGEAVKIDPKTSEAIKVTGQAAKQVQSLVGSIEKDTHLKTVEKTAELLGLEREDIKFAKEMEKAAEKPTEKAAEKPAEKPAKKPASQTVALSQVWAAWEAAQAKP